MPWLINAAQLDKFRKNQKNILILDASKHAPNTGRDAKQEFVEKHIIDAHFFDIESLCDTNNPLPNMLSLDSHFLSKQLGIAGLRDHYKIVFYDQSDLHTAYRALWMLKIAGHNPQLLYILDGGLKAWEAFQGKTESGMTTLSSKPYEVNVQLESLRTLAQMKNNIHTPSEQVVDVRHPVRFAGGPDMRADLRRGHIPGSFSFPYTSLFDKNHCLKPLDKIRTLLFNIGIDLDKPIVATCGSATTAPILDFILDLLNHPKHGVYDGSWSEWGATQLYAGETSLTERPVKTCLE